MNSITDSNKAMNSGISQELYYKIHEQMPICCVDVLIKTTANEFMLLKRNTAPAKDKWWLIGGRVRKNEWLEDAAKRKVREELGLEIGTFRKIISGNETIFTEDPFGHGCGTHSINTVYVAEITEEQLNQVKLDQFHTGYGLFKTVDPSWHPYLRECLAEAGFKLMTSNLFIPVCEPTLAGNELSYVTQAVKTGWISSAGEFINQFERKFADYCGVEHGVSCSSGTTALHLALEAVGIGQGDEVITPTFSMAASTNAIIYARAKPVFVDSELDTWNMDVSKIEEKITPKTKAIMVVHTYGHPVDMDPVNDVARRHKLVVIEDAAEAHGAEYKGRKAGSLGDIACFSFYANKIVTSGEGGMVVTNNKHWAERARKLRNHFFGEPRFLHQEIGYNYRLTNLQAALGLAQLERIDELVEARRHNAYLYNHFLKNVVGLTLPPEKKWAKNVYWMYGILVQERKFGLSMKQLLEELKKKGIECRTFFIGLHKQPAYGKDEPHFPDWTECPTAEILERDGLYLPSSSHLSVEQIEHITDVIKEVQKNAFRT